MAYHLFFTLAFLSAAGLSSAAEPIGLCPGNPHYFLFRGKPTVLITSGEHYGAVLNLDFDYVKYLDELKRHGLNLTRTFSGIYVEQWGEGWNTLNPAPGRYTAPWARSEEPGYADGGNKFDLTEWDPAYFARLRDFVAEAGKRDIVVEMVLFCVYYDDKNWALSPLNARNNINGIGTLGRRHVFDESDSSMMDAQRRVVKKIVRELSAFDNVHFELCNEPYHDEGPALGSPWNDRLAGAIRVVTDRHLIALNVANGSKEVGRMHPGVDVFNFHYCRPPDAVAQNYDHAKPIAFDESGFKGPGSDVYRRYAWGFIIAGGAVFSGLDWSFTVDSEEGRSADVPDRLGHKDPALRPQLGYLKRFIDGFDFIRMKPDNAVVKGGIPEGATARVLAEAGRQYAVYVNGGKKANLRLDLPKGEYSVEWLNTRSGKIDKTEQLKHAGGEAVLASPDYDGDIALAVRSKNPSN